MVGVVDATELAVVDDIVAGRRPIRWKRSPAGSSSLTTTVDSPFAKLHPRERAGTRVEVKAVSWAAVAFRVRSAADDVHVVVPRRWLRSFLEQLDGGMLDRAWANAAPTAPGVAGPRVVRSAFDPRMVLPPEPRLRASRSRDRRIEIVGVIAGGTAAAVLHRFAPW